MFRTFYPSNAPALILWLFTCGIGTLLVFIFLTVMAATVAHRLRPQPAVAVEENTPYQVQLDEATLLQQLSIVPELRFLEDDRIKRAKVELERDAGFRRPRPDEDKGKTFVEELNKSACDRAERAGLSINWEFMFKSEKEEMVSLSNEWRKNKLISVESSRSSFLSPSQEHIAKDLSSNIDVRRSSSLLPTMVQVLQVEPEPWRLVLIDKLKLVGYGKPKQLSESLKAMAARAIYDNSTEVREAALNALEHRDKNLYMPVLLKGLDYPWPPVVWRAAYALRKLGTLQNVPELTRMIEKKPKESKTDHVKELVRVSHLHSCLFCHKPSFDDSGSRVPIPGEPLISKDLSSDAGSLGMYAPVKPRELAVDPGATCLHQDFSVLLPVTNCGSWPDKQRFDFTTRVRPATNADTLRMHEMYRERQRAAYYALEGIVARQGKDLSLSSNP